MRPLGLAFLAVAFASQAFCADFAARRILDDVRAYAGDAASLPECEGPLQERCSVALGHSFFVRIEATGTGDLISLRIEHNEMFADTADEASEFVLAVVLAVGGEDNAEAVAALMDRAMSSEEPVEEVIGGARYRVSAESDIFLEVVPVR